jgi:hypothetical protein
LKKKRFFLDSIVLPQDKSTPPDEIACLFSKIITNEPRQMDYPSPYNAHFEAQKTVLKQRNSCPQYVLPVISEG